jgi:hypothetical protein
MRAMQYWLKVVLLLSVGTVLSSPGHQKAAFSSENERVDAYNAKGYTWPPKDLKPNTKGALMVDAPLVLLCKWSDIHESLLQLSCTRS